MHVTLRKTQASGSKILGFFCLFKLQLRTINYCKTLSDERRFYRGKRDNINSVLATTKKKRKKSFISANSHSGISDTYMHNIYIADVVIPLLALLIILSASKHCVIVSVLVCVPSSVKLLPSSLSKSSSLCMFHNIQYICLHCCTWLSLSTCFSLCFSRLFLLLDLFFFLLSSFCSFSLFILSVVYFLCPCWLTYS